MQTPILACIAAVVFGMAVSGGAQAQPPAGAAQGPGVKRTPLQTFDVPGGDYQTIIGLAEIAPNQGSGRHSHPGPEGGYLLQGSGTILADGQPPLKLKAGQSYKLPPSVVHDVRGGPHGLKMIVTWVVQKNRPLAAPAN